MDTTDWKQITARYLGRCQHCKINTRPGTTIYWQTKRSWTVHDHCWTDYQQAVDAALWQKGDPVPTPPAPRPEPERPDLARVCLDSQAGRHDAVFTDTWITLDGKTLFLSLLGADSYVKSVSGYLLDSKSRYSRDLVIKIHGDEERGAYCYRQPDTEAHYRVITTKSGPATHQLVADSRFYPGMALEKDYRFLLLEADADPAAELFKFLNRSIPTPMMPDWAPAIYAAMVENAGRYHKPEPHMAPTSELIPAKVGKHRALKIRTDEESHDALISHLARTGQVTF